MTCDDFRRKCITSKQSATESPPQFLARLEHYLLRWIALSKTEETFQSLRDFMLREQFMSSVFRELSVFLRENAADDLDVMSELAHKFTMARDHVAYTEPAAGKSRESPIKATHEARGSEARTQYSPPRCFSCGNTGHLRNSCPNSERRFVGVRGRQDDKWNGSLKRMLKRMCAERMRDWDRYLDPLMFAYREAPQESTRFSPFELL